jgi:hypothetical protein
VLKIIEASPGSKLSLAYGRVGAAIKNRKVNQAQFVKYRYSELPRVIKIIIRSWALVGTDLAFTQELTASFPGAVPQGFVANLEERTRDRKVFS